MEYQQIIKLLEIRRLKSPISGIEYARKIGVSYNTLKNWESLTNRPTVPEFIVWCELFGIIVDFEDTLVDDSSTERQPTFDTYNSNNQNFTKAG